MRAGRRSPITTSASRRSTATRGWETPRMSYIVNRPAEPGFRLQRQEVEGRNVRYTVESYAAQAPEGERYV